MDESHSEQQPRRRCRHGGITRRTLIIVVSAVLGALAFGITGVSIMNARAEKAATQQRIKKERRMLREKKAAEAAIRAEKERAARAAAEQAKQERREAEKREAAEAEAARAEAARRSAEEAAAKAEAKVAEEVKTEKAPASEEKATPSEEPEPKAAEKVEEAPIPENPAPAPAYDAPLNLLDSSQAPTYEQMVNTLLERRDFQTFLSALLPRIREAAPELIRGEKLNYPAYKAAPQLVDAVDLCLIAALVPPQTLNALCEKEPDFMRWMLRDKEKPLHELLRWYMLEEGNPQCLGHSLAVFCEIWKVCPKTERSKYLNLAIACALVHPGLVRSRSMLRRCKEPMLTMPQIFTYFRGQDKKRKLLTNIRKMSPERLLNVVNFRLPQSELDWVNDNLDYKRRDWGKTYSSVRYLMERATQNVDPYKDYTLAEILEKGGVCRDQAYFCAMSAKAKGIPSIYATGDGDRGPHAWVVLLADDKTWTAINNYGYTSGRFMQPCSARSVHESVFLNQTKAERADKLAPAGDAMLFSYLLARAGAVNEARGSARFLTAAFPTLTAAWTNLIKVLEADEENHPVTTAQWERVDRELNAAARKNAELADIAGELEDRHLGGKRKSNLNQVKRRAGDSRADVVVAAVEREARQLSESKNYRALATLYNKQLKDYTDRGDIFQELVMQYMEMIDEADARTWGTMAKDVEKLFNKKVRGDGSDYFKLTKEVEIQKLLSQAYAKAGNKKKAEKIFTEATERLHAARGREER